MAASRVKVEASMGDTLGLKVDRVSDSIMGLKEGRVRPGMGEYREEDTIRDNIGLAHEEDK